MQAGLVSGRVRRKISSSVEAPKDDNALVGPAERHAAVGGGADAARTMKRLLSLRGRPRCAAGGQNFHRALKLHNLKTCAGGCESWLRLGKTN